MSDHSVGAYLAGELKGEALTAFEAHAAGCAECRREIANWRGFGRQLAQQLAPVRRAPTRSEVAALLAAADAPRAPKWVVPAFAFAAIAAVIIAVVVRRPVEQPWAATVVASNELTAHDGTFSTQAAGRGLVHIGEDEVGLAGDTSVTVAQASSVRTVLKLGRGTIAAHVNPARGKRDFAIETAFGRVHVVGTVFRVKTTATALEVEVIRGLVEVETNGVVTKVPAGQALRGGAVVPFEAPEFTELMAEPPVVAPVPVEEPDAGVVEVVAPKKVVAPVAAWRTAAAHGECATVIAAAEKFVARDSSDAEAYLVLGDCRRRQREFEPAVAAYVAASKTKKSAGKKGLLQAAELLQQEMGQPAQAVTMIDSYLRTKPERGLEAAALVRKARALTALGRKAEAKAVLTDAVKRLPETPSAVEASRLLETL